MLQAAPSLSWRAFTIAVPVPRCRRGVAAGDRSIRVGRNGGGPDEATYRHPPAPCQRTPPRPPHCVKEILFLHRIEPAPLQESGTVALTNTLLGRRDRVGHRPTEAAVTDLLGRWLELGELERRAFKAMTEELTGTANLIEGGTTDLSHRFRGLPESAEAQTARVERIAGIAKTINVEREAMPLSDAARLVEAALGEAIDTLTEVARQAARMVQTPDQVTVEVAGAEQCVTRMEAINKQARFVALNAAIEAQRAEGAGGTFKIIAHELKEMAHETDVTSRLVRERILAVAGGVRGAHAELQAIAGVDRSAQQRTRARLDASAGMAGTVSRLFTGAQFQDRANQHLSHLKEAVEAMGAATEALQQETREAVPALAVQTGIVRPSPLGRCAVRFSRHRGRGQCSWPHPYRHGAGRCGRPA